MNELFNTIFRDTIGYDTLAHLASVANKYPPHNITKLTDDKYIISLAVAGFSKDELSVAVNEGMLKVTGTKAAEATDPNATLLYRGISSHDFERQWKLGEYVEVTSVKLENGLLSINLERKTPEEKKVKTLNIL